MEKIRVSAVRYANTFPFIYGLTETGFDKKIILETDYPSDCATKLINGSVDIGLVPVAILPEMKEYHIITDFCLGAYGKVRTVLLLSNVPLNEITVINLDYRSRSSVNLARILAKNAWKRKFDWNNTSENFNFIQIPDNEAIVIIGDLCFDFEDKFKFKIDLAEEWFKFTGLPFAFACWTANRELDNDFLTEFNNVLGIGVRNITAVVDKYCASGPIGREELKTYLTINMNYDLNDDKRNAIELFLDLLKKL